jgi:DNA polymerase-3 subunit alpha
VVESLIKCGAFDFSGASRAAMMQGLEQILKLLNAPKKTAEGQANIFKLLENSPDVSTSSVYQLPDVPEWDESEKTETGKRGHWFLYYWSSPGEVYSDRTPKHDRHNVVAA